MSVISRQEQKNHTRTQILTAARELISQNGFAHTTARDVATSAQVAIGTVFLHFPTMGALAEEVLDEIIGAALEQAAITPAATPKQPHLIDTLVHTATTLYEAYDHDPELSRQVIAGSLFESSPQGPSAQRITDFSAWVQHQVAAAVQQEQIEPIDPNQAFSTYFALYFGALVAGLRGEMTRPQQQQSLRHSLEQFFKKTGDTT